MPARELHIDELLSSYPRKRPPLPPAWKERYAAIYKEGRGGKTLLYRLTQILEGWMHRQVGPHAAMLRVLEIGAGTLNHLDYVNQPARYDAIEPFRELYANSVHVGRIGRFYDDIADVEPGARYDRVISIAALEHLTDLPRALVLAARVLAPGGEFHAGIPSEGGFLWGAAWRCTVGLSCRLRHRLDYGELMRHEHVSTAPEIIALVGYVFRKCEMRRFPLPLHHWSLYTSLRASGPIEEHCERIMCRYSEDGGLRNGHG